MYISNSLHLNLNTFYLYCDVSPGSRDIGGRSVPYTTHQRSLFTPQRTTNSENVA
jgi:hypothetical protein